MHDLNTLRPIDLAEKLEEDDEIVKFDEEGNAMIDWAGDGHGADFIEAGQLATPERLLGWVAHHCTRKWVDPWKLSRLVQIVADRHGWDIWRDRSTAAR
jgi:hypothetical protein